MKMMKRELLKKMLRKLENQLTEIDEFYARLGELQFDNAEVERFRADLMVLIADIGRMAQISKENSGSCERRQ
jgi:hypothetical protein